MPRIRCLFFSLLLLWTAPTVVMAQFDAISTFFQEMSDLGILRFNSQYIASDLYNLFLGKRRVRCALKMKRLIEITGPLLEGGYRDDSIMILPEAGPYVGNDSILEYVRFADSGYSPYIREGPANRGERQIVVGYDGKGQCEYHWFRLNGYTMEERYVERESHFALPVLTKAYLDYEEEYLKRAHVYYAKPFLQFYFAGLLSTDSVAHFVCDEALGSDACVGKTGEPPEDCVQRFMNDLPLTDANDYVDGDSRSCRVLHATFVDRNPSHCAHVTLLPSDPDPKGAVKCSASYQLQHDRFFDGVDMEEFRQFQVDFGIDPSVGYRELSSIDERLL